MNSLKKNLLIAGGLVGALVLAFAISNSGLVRANTDYICTRTIDTEGECANGTWGPWNKISETTDAQGKVTKVEERTYTGQRTLSTVIEYLNLRTNCSPGFTQTVYGSAGGASGFHGGKTYNEYQVCQISQKRTTVPPTTPTTPGGPTTPTTTPVIETSGPVDVGDVLIGGNAEIDSATELQDLILREDERAGLANITFSVKPKLVRRNATTVVSWDGMEAATCKVMGTNGDVWTTLKSPITGQVSGPIPSETDFTLVCLSAHGAEFTRTETVDVIASFEEI